MNEDQERENSTGGRLSAPAPDLAGMSDGELLHMRICDLKLKIAGSELESRFEKFYAELAAKGIGFRPLCYLGDEWFCPEGCATIAIPFYLAHPRLKGHPQRFRQAAAQRRESARREHLPRRLPRATHPRLRPHRFAGYF